MSNETFLPIREIRVESIGKDLTFHGQAYDKPAASTDQQWGGNQPATQEDPWATPTATNSGGGWGSGPTSEPPF